MVVVLLDAQLTLGAVHCCSFDVNVAGFAVSDILPSEGLVSYLFRGQPRLDCRVLDYSRVGQGDSEI